MRALALGLVLFASACGEAPTEVPPFALRAVVAPAIAHLEALVPPPPPAPEADADVREACEAILGPLRAVAARLRPLVIEDARRLPPSGVELLAQALLDAEETAATRVGLAEVLGTLATPRALEALCRALETAPEPAVRAAAARCLGLARDDRVVPRLVLRLKYEKDYETVAWLADALARLGALAGLEALEVLAARAPDDALRAKSAARLAELAREHGLAQAADIRPRWSEGLLAARGEPSPALVLEGWRWIARLGDWNLRPVDDARFVLVGLEDWIVPMLAEALHEDEVHVRLHAAQALERRGARARGAAPELEAALREPRLAPAAADALGALGVASVAPVLESAARTSLDPELRAAATRALGRLGLPRSRPTLEALFASADSYDLRQTAAQALLALDPAHPAADFLCESLTDERADAGAAEHALGAWLATRAASDPAAAEQLARWNALDPDPERIPSEAEARARQRARAELLRARAR